MLMQKMGNSCAIALSVGIAALAVPGVAEAAMLTHSTPRFSPDDLEFPFASLPYFDAGLGKLNRVILELVGEAETTVQLENLSQQKGFGQGYAVAFAGGAVYTVREGVGLWWPVIDEARAQIAQPLGPFDGALDGGGLSGATAYTKKTFDAALVIDSEFFGSDMQFFEGVGSYAAQLYAFTEGEGSVSSGDYALDWQGNVSNVGLRVTYDYTPVSTPEPGGAPVILLGLVGWGTVLLRRRKVAR
ncbi:choice-of-anchor E domain-containing protein [Pseudanabaena sp. FACHB-2040]|uniref:choice-of-anchor E domain-containing protein n=1 Tax=Pseudanabaena sp. FACHB-2040 TaxID=2692859 RepID=UPI001684016A|nr:choice-of-anchor E domain-containing protein [Pseudanabaena sp. FACHB-2040]MBD2260611.1 choice-of-anchor E domain-containing protein [Pseudanabaena sp. FACHB-2040]